MRVRVGTSGYSYREWKGRFYPRKIKPAEMLPFYAARFATVEINNTFYKLPSAELMAGWASQVGDSFLFALKAPGRITHTGRLKNALAPTEALFRVAAELGGKLGPILFGLPPNMKADVPRLRDFLAAIPHGPRLAFEFRHPSWFGDDTWQTLRDFGCALCVAEADGEDGEPGLVTPLVATTDWGYLRLRKKRYGPVTLQKWSERIRSSPWTEAFVYFKHEDEGSGPRYAAAFEKLLAKP